MHTSSSENAMTSIDSGQMRLPHKTDASSSASIRRGFRRMHRASGTVSMCDPRITACRLHSEARGHADFPRHPNQPSCPATPCADAGAPACTSWVGGVRKRRVMRPGSSVIAAMCWHSARARTGTILHSRTQLVAAWLADEFAVPEKQVRRATTFADSPTQSATPK